MISDIKKARKCLKYVSMYRQNIVFMHELIMHSNKCVEKINNTHEAHAFNFILSTLHARMVLDLRKILEPTKNDKLNNIAALIDFIKNHKAELIKLHYDDYLSTPTHECGKISSVMRKHLQECNEEEARKASLRCKETIEKIGPKWDRIWKNLYDIRPARTVIAHSVDPEIAKLPSLSKIRRLLNISKYFIEKLDFAINNSCYDYELEQEQLSDVAKKFWNRLQ